MDVGGKIYFVDFPGLGLTECGQDVTKRGRWNFKIVTIWEGERCSETRTCNIRFSMKQHAAPKGTDWSQVSDVPDDNNAEWAKSVKITWNLE